MALNTYPETLPWYRSHVIVGALLAIVLQIANAFGLIEAVSPDVQAEIADKVVNGLTAIFGLYVIWGRTSQKAAPPITGGKMSSGRTGAYAMLLAPALAMSMVALPGCSVLNESPRVAADQTLLDEQMAIAVESSYQAAAQILLVQVRSGQISGEDLEKAEAFEAKAFLAVKAVRSAYDAGNSDSFASALPEALRAIADFRKLIGAN